MLKKTEIPTVPGRRLYPAAGDEVVASDGRRYKILKRKKTRIHAHQVGYPMRFQILEVLLRCKKVRYATQKDAEAILLESKIKRGLRNNKRRREQNSYYCDDCAAWHLTSQARLD